MTTSRQEAALRRQMVATCLRMNATGINQGTAGNLSVRCGDGFLITPSSLPYDQMKPDDIMYMDFDGQFVGKHRPSSEWRFHRDILRHRGDINAVLHCHSMYATTLAIHHKTIPACHYMVGVAGGTTIRCARYATFGTQALSDAALEALDGRLACLLGQHGQISLGTTLDGALWLANEVETLSRMYTQALTLGEPPILSDEEMGRVIDQMRRMSYGMMPEPEGSNDVARPLAPAKPARRAKATKAALKAKVAVKAKVNAKAGAKAKAKRRA
jgi:L-fuculose-phosphate aldolase